MNAFDLHEQWQRYRDEGGRKTFTFWCGRYGDHYGCDAEWFAEDYLSFVLRHEDADTTPPLFRDWLASETAEYRAAHTDITEVAS